MPLNVLPGMPSNVKLMICSSLHTGKRVGTGEEHLMADALLQEAVVGVCRVFGYVYVPSKNSKY